MRMRVGTRCAFWVVFGIVAVVAVLACIVGAGSHVDDARAAGLGSDMVDSFTMQVKRVNTDVWEDLPTDGGSVGVYDTVRYRLNFHVPAGTLSASGNTLEANVLLDGKKDGFLWSARESEKIAEGRIVLSGVDCGSYVVTSNLQSRDVTDDMGKYKRDLSIRLTFNEDVVERNRTMALNDGSLYFDWNANRLVTPGNRVALSVGNHRVDLDVQQPRIMMDKQSVGEPEIDYTNGTTVQHWRIVLKNDGDLPLYQGWKLSDSLYELGDGESVPDGIGSRGAAFWGFSHTEKSNNCSALLKNTGLSGRCNVSSGTIRSGRSFYSRQTVSDISQLDAGRSIVMEYDTQVPIDNDVKQYVNRVYLDSDYVSTVVSSSEQSNPAKGLPVLSFGKKSLSTDNPDDCHVGDDNCHPRQKWELVLENTGKGIMPSGWQIVDDLRFNSASNSQHYYTAQDVSDMVQAIRNSGYDCHVDSLYDLLSRQWVSITDNDIPGDGQVWTGVSITVDTAIRPGDRMTVPYHSHMDWSEALPTSGTYGSSDYGTSQFSNLVHACGDINAGNRYCWSDETASTRISSQSMTKICRDSNYDYARMSDDDEFEYCLITNNITNRDVGKEITYHETMTPSGSGETEFKVEGFTLSNTMHDRDAVKDNPNLSNAWFVNAPHEIGGSVHDSTYSGESGKPVTIVKTGIGQWDITFPADWQWDKMMDLPETYKRFENQRNIYVQYYPNDVPGWDTLQKPVWTDSGFDKNTMGISNTTHAIVTDGIYDMTSSSTATVSIHPRTSAKKLEKTSPLGTRGTDATYRVYMNTMALDLNPDGDTVDVQDEMVMPKNTSTDIISVNVWTTSKKNALRANLSSTDSGNPWRRGNYSTFINDEHRLSQESYEIQYDKNTHVLTLNGLPDNQQLAIEYHVRINSTQDTIPNVNNTATLMANGKPIEKINKATSRNTITVYQSGATVNITGIYLRKTDKNDSMKQLANASYELQQWDNDARTWTVNRTITTSSNANTTIDQLECGRAYRLIERKAPAGYVIDDTPYDFSLTGCNTSIQNGMPNDWHGTEYLVMDTVTMTDERIPGTSTLPKTGTNTWGLVVLLTANMILLVIGAHILFARRATGCSV